MSQCFTQIHSFARFPAGPDSASVSLAIRNPPTHSPFRAGTTGTTGTAFSINGLGCPSLSQFRATTGTKCGNVGRWRAASDTRHCSRVLLVPPSCGFARPQISCRFRVPALVPVVRLVRSNLLRLAPRPCSPARARRHRSIATARAGLRSGHRSALVLPLDSASARQLPEGVNFRACCFPCRRTFRAEFAPLRGANVG